MHISYLPEMHTVQSQCSILTLELQNYAALASSQSLLQTMQSQVERIILDLLNCETTQSLGLYPSITTQWEC